MKKSRHTPEQVTYGHEGKIVAVAERAGFSSPLIYSCYEQYWSG